MPALADYYSSDDDDDDDDDVLPVALATPTVGDSIFSTLDRALGPEPVVFSSNQAHRKKREIREYNSRPVDWVEIADYYKINRNVSGTIFHFGLKSNNVKEIESKKYWATTLGRWMMKTTARKRNGSNSVVVYQFMV